MGKKIMMISVSHVNTHQRLPKQRTIFIIKWIRLTVMWIPVSFFPQPPLSSPNKPMDKVAMVTGIEIMHGLNKTDFHSSKLAWLQPLLSTQSVSNKDQHLVKMPYRRERLPTPVFWPGEFHKEQTQLSNLYFPWSGQRATLWVEYTGPLPS